jgi:antitoxin (DNA-binding transcriptional repressor) of toxin-antitoxin stability system
MTMPVYTVHAAKTQLSRLIQRALAGEEVIIARDTVPAVRLIPIKQRIPKREPGTMRGRLHVPDSFFDPLSEEELRLWYGEADEEPADENPA